MKRFSIPPREERERHSHTMSAYIKNDTFVLQNLNPQWDIKRGFLPKSVSNSVTLRK